jgi:hypothetical protein
MWFASSYGRDAVVTMRALSMVVYEAEIKDQRVNRAEPAERLRTIVVAGVSSGAGKTCVAEALTRLMAERCRTAAAKITVTHGERGCPHGGKGCDVCGSLGGDFQVITRDNIILQPETDTARLAAAGGSPVVWAITKENHVAEAWREMSRLMSNAACAVIESNTLAQVIKPTLTLMVVDPSVSRKIWKPSAERLIASAERVIFNDRGPQLNRAERVAEVLHLRGSIRDVIFVSHPHQAAEHPALLASLTEVLS